MRCSAGSLPGRLRELVILRTAARFGGRYEWAQHIELAEAQGVNPAEFAALGDEAGGLDAPTWSPLERAALAAVDETADDGAVSDATWDQLADLLRESQLIELLMLIGALPDADDRSAVASAAARAAGGGVGATRPWRTGGVGAAGGGVA